MIFNELLVEPNNNVLDDLLERCNSVKAIDLEHIKKISIEAASGKGLPQELIVILDQWYNSLSGAPDYSVYGVDEYIAELWGCWKIYSKTHLRNIQKENSLFTHSIASMHSGDTSIIDLGCGFAYTTAAIKQIFPNANVWGTNLDNTLQMSVAKTMAADYNFTMAGDCSEISQNMDLVFASEYFEHFERPIEHLDYVIDNIAPKAMLIANAFGTEAIGHFNKYQVKTHALFDWEWMDAKTTSRMFNDRVRKHGYKKVKTKLWNNRPSYWVK